MDDGANHLCLVVARMRRHWRGLVAAAAVTGCVAAVAWVGFARSGEDEEPSSAPLDQKTTEGIGIYLSADASRRADLDPGIDLANPGDRPIRILRIESVPDPESPAAVNVTDFRLAGPDREVNSISGGRITDADYGTRLIPSEDAVLPPGAMSDDYVLVVTFEIAKSALWARDRALDIHYSVGGTEYTSRWQRYVVFCSEKLAGEEYCKKLFAESDKDK